MTKNTQIKLNSVRPPRVRVVYEVETEGAMVQKELPLVVVVISELKGNNTSRVAYKDRQFLDIDKDNFNQIIEYLNPQLMYSVNNVLGYGSDKLSISLDFKSMEDFEMKNIIAQIPELKSIFDKIELLKELGIVVDTNVEINQSVMSALLNKEKRTELMETISSLKSEIQSRIDVNSGDGNSQEDVKNDDQGS